MKENTGDINTGDINTGDCNTGDCNTGDSNTGDCNTGDWNTGDWNTGDSNTGDWNTGDSNTGGWNTGDCNTGYCNSIIPKKCLIFNKEALIEDWEKADKPNWLYVNLTSWVKEINMTDKEKEAYPSYVTTGGYLKAYNSLKESYVDAWEKASEEDKLKTFKLPNYDEDVFKEVFGFTPNITKKVKVVCEGKEVWLSEESAKALNLIK